MTGRALVLLCLVTGCGGPFIGPSAGMGWRWKIEPTVGASRPELVPPLTRALERWGYGVLVPDCRGADICVVGGQRNHAGPRGDRCVAEVETDLWYVVAHEVGHCLGLPHSDDSGSVMYHYSRDGQDVTDTDRRAVRAPPTRPR